MQKRVKKICKKFIFHLYTAKQTTNTNISHFLSFQFVLLLFDVKCFIPQTKNSSTDEDIVLSIRLYPIKFFI